MTNLLLSLYLSLVFVVACSIACRISYRVGLKVAKDEHQRFFCAFAHYARLRHHFPATDFVLIKGKWIQKFGKWDDQIDEDVFNNVWNVVNEK